MKAVAKLTVLLIALAALAVPTMAQSGGPGNGDSGYDRSSGSEERRSGAPGKACRRAGHEPGTGEFRRCVREKAKARGRKMGRHRGEQRRRARRECRDKGIEQRTKDFRECVREEARELRRERRERRREAVEECRDKGIERPSADFRECVRDEVRERRPDRDRDSD